MDKSPAARLAGPLVITLPGMKAATLVVAMSALAAAIVVCSSLALRASQRIDLVHAVYFNSCSFHAYQFHWQEARRLRETFRYDFTMSPDTFVLLEIWVTDGPTFRVGRNLPVNCRVTTFR